MSPGVTSTASVLSGSSSLPFPLVCFCSALLPAVTSWHWSPKGEHVQSLPNKAFCPRLCSLWSHLIFFIFFWQLHVKCRISRNLITDYMNVRKQNRNYMYYFLFNLHSNSDVISDQKYIYIYIYIFGFVSIPGRTPWNFLNDGGNS